MFYLDVLTQILQKCWIWSLHKLWPWISWNTQGCYFNFCQDLKEHLLIYNFRKKPCILTLFPEVLLEYSVQNLRNNLKLLCTLGLLTWVRFDFSLDRVKSEGWAFGTLSWPSELYRVPSSLAQKMALSLRDS